MKDVRNNFRHNERKATMLHAILKADKYLTPSEIADNVGITPNNARRQLSKLYGQGYIWRRTNKIGYKYGFLKLMGHRVSRELWIRKRLKAPLNLKKNVPSQMLGQYRELANLYTQWAEKK